MYISFLDTFFLKKKKTNKPLTAEILRKITFKNIWYVQGTLKWVKNSLETCILC